MNTLILARHGHAASNLASVVSAVPPGGGLSEQGREEAGALGVALASEPIDLGVTSRLLRARETLELALAGRKVPLEVEPLLDEIGFGDFEGGSLSAYRTWAWENGPVSDCPGGGESRVGAAARFSRALVALLARPEQCVLAISHALPIRYVLDAADGSFPAARIDNVPHATPYRLARPQVELAAETLRAWATDPRFAGAAGDTPFGG